MPTENRLRTSQFTEDSVRRVSSNPWSRVDHDMLLAGRVHLAARNVE
jgi:hypothetical protein